MGLFDSLPDRPIKRDEIEQLQNSDVVQGVYPVYGELKPNTAFGLVILMNGKIRAWAYEDEWVEINEKEIDDPHEGRGGLPISEQDTLQQFQDEITERIAPTDVA